ncbi:hypothetical protein SDC9_148547 [bioreactor metagenome]|uniref:Uncharacterized protein n=1 Tax=bioreactor metagenome TaxID=1076179 RepID=A0A645EH54_9ZZZZ
MRVEDVYILQAHPSQALVEAGEHILSAPPLPIYTWPHAIPCLGGDDQLITIGREVLGKQFAEVQFSRSCWRSIVVSQIKVGDSQIECGMQHLAGVGQGSCVPKIMPEPKGDGRELQTAFPASVVEHRVVAFRIWFIHEGLLDS